MSTLTKEQQALIAANRQQALEKRKLALKKPCFSNTNNGTSVCQSNGPIKYGATSLPFNTFAQSSSGDSKGATKLPVAIPKKTFYGRKTAVSFSIISDSRFVAECDYHQKAIEKFKSIPNNLYDPAGKKWTFELSSHNALVKSLKEIGPEISLTPLPHFVLRNIHEPLVDHTKVDLSSLDPVILEALMPFQKEGVQKGVSRGGRLLLADDMGLGKTIQAIAIMNFFHDWPLLVICPSSVRYHWRDAFLRFLPSQHPSTISVLDNSRDAVDDARILISSYDLLTRCADRLKQVGFLSVIADESHCLKNFKSARTRAAQPLLSSARRCLLLSGTPALSRPIELYTQVAAVRRQFAASYNEFGQRYCEGSRNNWGWDFSGASHMTELQVLLERHVMVRRLKRDVMDQLPDKQRVMVVLNADGKFKPSGVMTQFEQRMAQGGLRGMERRGTLLQYFRETASAKLPAVLNYLDDLLDSGAKFICFGHHQLVLDGVCELLERRDVSHMRIDGSTDAELRKQHCDRFQTSDEVRVAVLSITAAGAGITLTAAALLVFAELFWNPGVLTQAEDRAHRIGQRDCVQVRYLVMSNTADDHIWPLVQRKLNVLSRAGLSKDNFTDVEQQVEEVSGHSDIADWFQKLDDLDDVMLGDLAADLEGQKCDLAADLEGQKCDLAADLEGQKCDLASDREGQECDLTADREGQDCDSDFSESIVAVSEPKRKRTKRK